MFCSYLRSSGRISAHICMMSQLHGCEARFPQTMQADMPSPQGLCEQYELGKFVSQQ